MTDVYNRLFEAWKRERHAASLQALDEGFFGEMSEYASRLRERARMVEKGSVRGRIAEKEKENAERMLRELFNLRLRKIVSAEVGGIVVDASALTQDERNVQAELRRLLSEHSERLKGILMGRALPLEAKPRREGGFKVVRFVEALPAIIGIDMKTYGPFRPEDVASIPAENAESLIKRGIAKEVEVSG
jgi:DNA replication factor GINS